MYGSGALSFGASNSQDCGHGDSKNYGIGVSDLGGPGESIWTRCFGVSPFAWFIQR
jgi:hypothetical protein